MSQLQCTICYEDMAQKAEMPCGCAREESTIAYCHRCIELICQGGVGQCPTCRSYITVDPSGAIRLAANKGRCGMCCQIHELVDRGLCAACLLGQRYRFTYECQRCHQTQVPTAQCCLCAWCCFVFFT